jgi:hypothetical protein
MNTAIVHVCIRTYEMGKVVSHICRSADPSTTCGAYTEKCKNRRYKRLYFGVATYCSAGLGFFIIQYLFFLLDWTLDYKLQLIYDSYFSLSNSSVTQLLKILYKLRSIYYKVSISIYKYKYISMSQRISTCKCSMLK